MWRIKRDDNENLASLTTMERCLYVAADDNIDSDDDEHATTLKIYIMFLYIWKKLFFSLLLVPRHSFNYIFVSSNFSFFFLVCVFVNVFQHKVTIKHICKITWCQISIKHQFLLSTFFTFFFLIRPLIQQRRYKQLKM